MGFLDDMRCLQQLAISRPATALVVAVRRESEAILGVVEIELDLEVSIRGARPYAVTHRELVDSAAADDLAAGTTIPVIVAPDRSIRVASV